MDQYANVTATPAQLSYEYQHINDDAQPQLIVSHVVCFTLAILAVYGRFYSRRLAKIKYEWDDWLIISALVCDDLHKIRLARCRDHGSSVGFLLDFHSFSLDYLHDGYVVLSLSGPFIDIIEWTVF